MNSSGVKKAIGAMHWTQWASLGLLLTIAFALRVYRIGDEAVFYDEVVTYMNLDEPTLMKFYIEEGFHDPVSVPVYYGSAYVWHALGFTSITAVRMLSVLAAMAAIVCVYGFGRRLFSHMGGLTAALCMSLAKIQIYMSQEIRNYAFMMLLTAIAMYALYRAVESGQRRWWAVNLIANVLAIHTHFFAMILLFAEGVYLLMVMPRKIHWIAAWTLVQVPFLALIPVWIKITHPVNVLHEANWIPRANIDRVFVAYYQVYAGSLNDAMDFIRKLPWGIPVHYILGALIMAAGMWYVMRSALGWWKAENVCEGFRPRAVALLMIWAFVPPATLFLLARYVQPCFIERYVLFASLGLYLIVGGGVALLPGKAVQYAAFSLLALVYAGNQVDLLRPMRYDLSMPGGVLRDEYAAPQNVYTFFEDIELPLQFYAGVREEHVIAADDFAELAAREAEAGNRSWICFFEVPDIYQHDHVEAILGIHDVEFARWVSRGRWNMYLYRIDPRRSG